MDRGRGRVRVRVRRPTAKIDATPASFCRPRRRLHVLDAAQREEEPRERTRGRPGSTPPAASIMMGITKKPAPTTETAMMAQASRRPGGTAPAPLLHRWYWLSLSSSSGVPPAQRGAAPRRPSCCRTSLFSFSGRWFLASVLGPISSRATHEFRRGRKPGTLRRLPLQLYLVISYYDYNRYFPRGNARE